MSSYQSSTSSNNASSFGGRGDSSDDGHSAYGASPTKHQLEGNHMDHMEPLNEEGKEDEPLDHPVLSAFNRETHVSNSM